MELKRITLAAAAAVFAVSGIGSILVLQGQPRSVDAIDLSDDPAIRRPEDNGPALELVDDDDSRGDGDDTNGDDGSAAGANTGDGDDTAGDDGTSGGNNTGDGDDTRGDDGTSGGNNTGDSSNTGGATTN